MPKVTCPSCGTEMKVNKHDVYICPNCKAVFLPGDVPPSIFGVH